MGAIFGKSFEVKAILTPRTGVGQKGGKMVMDLEQEIRSLQKELAGIQKDQAVLRLQPCRGDAEIMAKDTKYDELSKRVASLRETIRDLTRKRQLLIFASTTR